MNYILEMENITKEFPGVKALDGVSFKVKEREIHALIGENGAGKSTLVKILSGVYPTGTYDGKIFLNGKEEEFKTIKDSEKKGISIIYQELALVKQLNIVENIFLGNEINKNGIIDFDQAFVKAEKMLNEVNLNVNPYTKVLNLGVGQQQLVEIAKALSKETKILILDEPTAALTETEIENLFNILKFLKKKGVTCIYISHKLDEIFEIADRVTILRDGKAINTNEISNLTRNNIISYMVGREMTQLFPYQDHQTGDMVFEVNNWTVAHPELQDKILLDNISFEARKGEILGIAGLMGSGRTELAKSIFGALNTKKTGEIIIDGKLVIINNPRNAIEAGIGYLSENRKEEGLNLEMDVKKNITMASHDQISNKGILDGNLEIKNSELYVRKLSIKTPSLEQKTNNLSGGNQQKVSLAKWLMTRPKVLFLDEPTRGIDVGAKQEIYNLMIELISEGICIIMISSELPEILGMSDRVLVMHEGKINGRLSREESSQEKIMYYATGGR